MTELLPTTLSKHEPYHQVPLNPGLQKQELGSKPETGSKPLQQQVIIPMFENNSIDIVFQKIDYKIHQKDGSVKHILKEVSGICKAGEVTAILGASGAGKTSLLNLLAKRIDKTATIKVGGNTLANNKPYTYEQFSKFGSYVMQDDRLLEAFTVKECLQFAANLKCAGTVQEKQDLVKKIIKQLKLERCQDTAIGGFYIKGISGGERKRTSIGFELVTKPIVIFLDEPTSGLDSFTAFTLINVLKKYAHERKATVIFTIHQPSSEVWKMFDRILLLVNGKLIYQGSENKVIKHFSDIGYACGHYMNPADYFLSIMHASDDKEATEKKNQIFQASYENQLQGEVEESIKLSNSAEVPFRGFDTSFCYQLTQISKRAIVNLRRNPLVFKARLVQTIIISLFSSAIYFNLNSQPVNSPSYSIDRQRTDIFNIIGSLYFIIIGSFISSLNPTLLTFPLERNVFLKEENSRLYSLIAYFFGKTLTESIPIVLFPIIQSLILYWLVGYNNETADKFFFYTFIAVLLSMCGWAYGILAGSAFSEPKVAVGVAPMFILPVMLFGGFFQNRSNYADWIGWLEYISPFKYALEAQIRNNFLDTKFQPDPVIMLGYTLGMWESAYILIAIFAIFYIGAFFFLRSFTKKLQ